MAFRRSRAGPRLTSRRSGSTSRYSPVVVIIGVGRKPLLQQGGVGPCLEHSGHGPVNHACHLFLQHAQMLRSLWLAEPKLVPDLAYWSK